MVGWCGACHERVVGARRGAGWDAAPTPWWVAALTTPDALDRSDAADAEDDRRVAAWCVASPRVTSEDG